MSCFTFLADATAASLDGLSNALKWDIIVWVAGGFWLFVRGLTWLVALYDRFANGKSLPSGNAQHGHMATYFVTQGEFRPLVRRVDRMEETLESLATTMNSLTNDLVGEVREIKGILKGKELIK